MALAPSPSWLESPEATFQRPSSEWRGSFRRFQPGLVRGSSSPNQQREPYPCPRMAVLQTMARWSGMRILLPLPLLLPLPTQL